MGGIVIYLGDEPLIPGEITGTVQRRSLICGKHGLDDQLKIKPTEPQHGHPSPHFSATSPIATYSS
jgi:hypothetical protein